MPAITTPSPAIRTTLKLESLAILAVAATAYFALGGSPWLFVLAFFAPDLSFAAYRFGPLAGARAYNLVHSYASAALLGALGWFAGIDIFWQLGLIMAAHIGFDRSLGYGLKLASSFQDTHLGRIGRDR